MMKVIGLFFLIITNIALASDGTIIRFKGDVFIDGKPVQKSQEVSIGQ